MPKALYKYLRDKAEANPNPIAATPAKTIQTSKQVTDYLLCRECEDRFNKSGEKWVIEDCWRSETDFPLQAALLAATPLFTNGPDFAAYSGAAPGVDVGRLAYFAASVVWRAGVHQWKQYGHAPQKLTLGPYQEQLRQYLMGNTGFPDDIVLIVTVSRTLETERNAMMLLPWLSDHEAYHKYAFVIPGVTFQVLIGKNIPSHVRDCCMVHSPQNYLFMSRAREEDVFQKMGQLLAKTV